MKYETSEFVYELVDDGTLDTVVQVTDLESGETWQERIDIETAAHYREDDGSFTETGFADFCDSIISGI